MPREKTAPQDALEQKIEEEEGLIGASADEADDDEPAPIIESGTEDDSEPASGPLKKGREAIQRFAKLSPEAPGVYRMIDADGDVLYVGKAKNIKKRVASYVRPTGHDTRIARMIAATATHRIRLHRHRDRSAAARSQPDQATAAALQRADARRQVVPLYPDHQRPSRAADPQASRRAQPAGRLFRPVRLGWAVNRTITALQRAFLMRSCSDAVFESRTRPCLLHQIKRCSAPCTGEIPLDDYAKLVREAREFLSGKSRAVKD